MTLRDPEFDEEHVMEVAAPGTWAAAAAAVSVLIIATITLTVVAGGWDLGSSLPFS
jgi:hypothetical protein